MLRDWAVSVAMPSFAKRTPCVSLAFAQTAHFGNSERALLKMPVTPSSRKLARKLYEDLVTNVVWDALHGLDLIGLHLARSASVGGALGSAEKQQDFAASLQLFKGNRSVSGGSVARGHVRHLR